MRKLLISLFFGLVLTVNSFAADIQSYPREGMFNFLGLDDTSAPTSVKDSRAADIQNITLNITGAAKKRYGYSLKNTTLDTSDYTKDNLEAVTSIYELYKSSGTRYFISTCGQKIFYDNSGTWTNITGSTTITEGQDYQWSWVTALDYAIGTNGTDPPIKYNGTGNASAVSFTGLSNALTKAKCVIWWKNYLIWGNTYEATTTHTTRIRWSNVGTVETYSDNDFVDIATLGGQQIEGFATLYDDLIVFLTDSIYKVSLVGGDELIQVTKVSEGIGCIAKNSIQNVQIGNTEGLIFLSRDKTINYFDGVKVTEISTNISNLMDGLSASRLPYAVSVDDNTNAHYYLAVTDGTASSNNLLLDFHYGLGEWSKHTQIDANALGVANDSNSNPQVYFGNYKAFVYQMQDSNLNSDIDGFTGTVTGVGVRNGNTESGLQVIFDSSATFTATGAIVRLTGGTGSGEEAVVIESSGSSICVSPTFTTTPDTTSTYSIGDIDAYYTTKWYDMGDSALRKNFAELFFWATSDTNADINVSSATDFSSTINTNIVTLYADGSLWGTAIWGTDTWGGGQTSLTRVPLNISGRFIKFRWRNDNIDEPMEIYGYKILGWGLQYF